jgi:hypothetical protein
MQSLIDDGGLIAHLRKKGVGKKASRSVTSGC